MLIGDIKIGPVKFCKANHFLQNLLIVDRIIADDSANYDGFTPNIQEINLGNGKIKFMMQTGKNGPEQPSFLFEGCTTRKHEMKCQHCEMHFCMFQAGIAPNLISSKRFWRVNPGL